MSCEECIDWKIERSGKMPDCKACGYTVALPENAEVIDILSKYGSFMYGGMGMPSIINIHEILKIEGKEYRKDLIDKIMIYVAEASFERGRERKPLRTITSKSKTIRMQK